MEFRQVPVKGQQFDIGRTINPFKCDCKKCDFLNCPKHNYAVKMRREVPKFKEFWECWGEDVIKLNPIEEFLCGINKKTHLYLTYDLINEMMECISFPKGTYWNHDDCIDWKEDIPIENKRYREIYLCKFNRRGIEQRVGSITISDGYIKYYDMNCTQEKLAERISKFIKQIIEQIVLVQEGYKG